MSDDRRDGARWRAAAATIAPNDAYVGARLLYRGPDAVEHSLVDTVDKVTVRAILRRLRNAFLVLAALTLGQSFGSNADGGSGAGAGLLGPIQVAVLIYVVFVLLVPMRDTLSEWDLVVDSRADLAESAYATVADELIHQHEIPARVYPKRKLVRMPQPGVRNFLLVRLGKYVIFVSVFAFGRDLYLGWSLVRRDVPLLFLLRYLATKLAGDPGYSRLMDIEPVKALREVVHNALRTGIEAAAVGRQIKLDSVFGQPIPVEDDSAAANAVTRNPDAHRAAAIRGAGGTMVDDEGGAATVLPTP